jgi:signal transduction histidine kinase
VLQRLRQMLHRLREPQGLSGENSFELLYRAARAVQLQPARFPQLLGEVLQQLFEPSALTILKHNARQSEVHGRGLRLVVPVTASVALELQDAQNGRRRFRPDDAQLADRVVEQLRRAVAYDQAVERGRIEERLRIAQDLHDDIGARLLTLIYQAQSREMEEYLRHTLQDLKTLTRGLAAGEYSLSEAAAEWKNDLTQRLAAARAHLQWTLEIDHDPHLSVAQWSALTRILRELVSNALQHGQATEVQVTIQLVQGQLLLRVADNGRGQAPDNWAHGLGLGGVRKRVRGLNGQVQWREGADAGIVCTVHADGFESATAPPDASSQA